ncbi:AT-hook motif nuclear-localized protein 10-like [Vigna radiata var. radiata]|uniref:AT-hook motif nuclear-localized protein n=1 Tax=Vigna radiata var. radiata TaxID=3916 RepID=A0A3Q0ES02_VIGRR|nr:AT-hook motif nuclear-localized protein 10-like [Vigna radiata var. radiata]
MLTMLNEPHLSLKLRTLSNLNNLVNTFRPEISTSLFLRCEWMNSCGGLAFSPHVITVRVGEDIVAKLFSSSQQRPRAFCILTKVGTVFSVTLASQLLLASVLGMRVKN